MLYPRGLTAKEASAIIVDVEQKLFDGTARTNRIATSIRRCSQCGVKFASKAFNYCPICAVRNAKHIDLQNTDATDVGQQIPYRPTFWQQHGVALTKAFYAAVGVCAIIYLLSVVAK